MQRAINPGWADRDSNEGQGVARPVLFPPVKPDPNATAVDVGAFAACLTPGSRKE